MKKILGFLLILCSTPSAAAWLSTSGTILNINFYAATDTVLVLLSSYGADTGCTNKTTFAIDGSLPTERRQQMVSALLSAEASGSTVNVYYEDSGGCVAWNTDSNAYRSIKRLAK